MDELQQLQHTEHFAPAYLIFGAIEQTFGEVKNMIEARTGIHLRADTHCTTHDVFGVDEARAVLSFALLKPLGGKKYIAIASNQMTEEAQHALLKLVEEGKGSSVFFFMVPHGAFILPTLISRGVVLKVTDQSTEVHDRGESFLRMSYAERLAFAEQLTKNHDREGARNLVRSLLTLSKIKKFSPALVRDLLEADQYLKLTGSSVKGVVGHLALVLG
ncbi:MAG: hypothetical protein AAB439_03175 [Patescibacteria group bacterium]